MHKILWHSLKGGANPLPLVWPGLADLLGRDRAEWKWGCSPPGRPHACGLLPPCPLSGGAGALLSVHPAAEAGDAWGWGWRGTEASYPEPEGATADSKQVSCPSGEAPAAPGDLQMTDCRSRSPQVSPLWDPWQADTHFKPQDSDVIGFRALDYWEIPWTEEPGRLQSPQHRKRVGHDLATKQLV